MELYLYGHPSLNVIDNNGVIVDNNGIIVDNNGVIVDNNGVIVVWLALS